jgi:multidrug efflux system membrane fusion protein
MAPPRRRFRWGFVLLGVLLLALLAWAVFGRHKPAPPKGPVAVSVSVAKVGAQDVPVSVDALGAAQAWQGVTINPQVNGRLLFVAKEGGDVKAGDVLATIDVTPYRAALLQTQGVLARDQALLAQARADLARYNTLAAQDSISKQQRDTQAALVKQDEGIVKTDQGAVAAAQVNVNYCTIRSPLNGRVGVRLVDPGNIVSTGLTTGILSVNQLDPIAVIFTVPQGDFERLAQASNGFTTPLATQAMSQETGDALGAGVLSIADNHVDPATGTVQLKARFPNGGKRLWPGQFVNVRLTLQTLSHATVAPATAVNQGPNGAYAYVVGANNKVAVRLLKIGASHDQLTVIQSGLNVGETVVTDGQMQLKPGMTVRLPGAKPPAGAAGKPAK